MKKLLVTLLVLVSCKMDVPGSYVRQAEKAIQGKYFPEGMAVSCLQLSDGRLQCVAGNGNKFYCTTHGGEVGCLPGSWNGY